MASPAELYARGVKKKLKYYYVAWLPNEELHLGDIGILTRGLFFRQVFGNWC